MFHPIDAILVPQGSEYRAVRRGLKTTKAANLLVVPIPIGAKSLNHLEKLQLACRCSQPHVLLMGLCGGLVPQYQLGDAVIYQGCVCVSNAKPLWLECDRHLTTQLENLLYQQASLGRGLTSKALVWSRDQKRYLGQKYQAEVVDMEGCMVLETLQQAGVGVAMLRVISDRACQELPNLNPAISAGGSLKPLPLGLCLLKQPIAATQLIRGSLTALKKLQHLTTYLFSHS